jgi:hypothetical protein
MSLLPRVTEKARELIAREFDACGPDACMAEIIEHLERHNPELWTWPPNGTPNLRTRRRQCLDSACSIVFSIGRPRAPAF